MAIHKNPDLLLPECQNKFWDFIKGCEDSTVLRQAGYRVIVLETLRDLATQMAYYSRSRMAIDDVKAMFKAAGLWSITDDEAKTASTWTLSSRHLSGKAFDAAPSKDGINPDWMAPAAVWDEIHSVARSVGLTCGVDFPAPKSDPPHFETA